MIDFMNQVPPNDLDAERWVLAAIMFCRDTPLVAQLQADSFYSEPHQQIFEAAEWLKASGEPCDIGTVANRLATSGRLESAGGLTYLQRVIESVPTRSAENSSEYHSRTVVNCWADRESRYATIEHLHGRLSRAELRCKLDEIESRTAGRRIKTIHEAIGEYHENWYAPRHVMPTGLDDLDTLLDGGFENGQLVIVAARTGVGKSAFVTSWLTRLDQLNQAAMICSVEMTQGEITERMVATKSRVPLTRLRQRNLSESQDSARMEGQAALCAGPKILLDDVSTSLSEIRANAIRHRNDIDILFVDYLQLVAPTGKHSNREQQVANVSRGLKVLAKQLEFPVVALAQLNRTQDGKVPTLSGLRESGSIEQDANIVIFLHVPDENKRFEVDAVVAKSRSGRTGTAKLHWNANITAFETRQPKPIIDGNF